jgi:hypothetical protein
MKSPYPKIPRKKRYKEGDWIAVPLMTRGYALGIVFRTKGPVCVGAFYAPRFEELPTIADTDGRSLGDAIFIRRFGYLGLQMDQWPVIGMRGDWNRDDWPMPVFSLGRLGFVRDDRDPLKTLAVRRLTDEEMRTFPDEGSSGPNALRWHLHELLDEDGLAAWDAAVLAGKTKRDDKWWLEDSGPDARAARVPT